MDGARAHTTKDTVHGYLNINVSEHIFPENWPQNSPDLNPVDFSIWGNLSSKVYRARKCKHLDVMKKTLLEEWNKFPKK